MNKLIPICLISVTVSQNIYSQIIIILNKKNLEPIQNVYLFNGSRNISTLTDSSGKANITNFGENDSIFFQHPSYHKLVYLKDELKRIDRIYLVNRVFQMDELVISATRSPEKKKYLPFMIDVIDSISLDAKSGQTSADILALTGSIFIQKSQGGGGSPVLRGFEANKILLVVDGVRMNNAIYRSGHLQNAITIDHSILDKVEIIYGPASLIYGSDALGGVIHYITKDPVISNNKDRIIFKTRAYTQYSSANSGKTGHLDFNIGLHKIGFLTSITCKDFGDISMGKNKNSFYGDFGEIKHFVKRINGQDSTYLNPDSYVQINTGYSQTDLLQKIKISPSSKLDIVGNFQYSTSSNIDRLDYLNDYNGKQLKYAAYYYGPQNRLLASLKTSIKDEYFLFSVMNSIFAFQKIDEDRYSRRFGDNNRFVQKEDVKVASYNHDFYKELKNNNSFNYGLELNFNHFVSTGIYENISNQIKEPGETRYPDGGTSSLSAAAYINYKWLKGSKYSFSTGIRYQYAAFSSEFKSGILPYKKININNGALTGSASMIYYPGKDWQINFIASTGFRNPNVDDYGKVRAKDGLVTVPNPGLTPEYTYNFEIGVTNRIEGLIKLSITAYYTWLTDAIVRSDFKLNGSDSLEYDNEMYKIITNINANKAFIRGLTLNLASDFNSVIGFNSTFNLIHGHDLSDDIPMAHIFPAFGRTSLTFKKNSFESEFFSEYNGWKRIEDFSPLGEDNESEATIDGSPSWFTLNIRAVYHIKNHIRIQFAIENILDTYYKPFASGVSAAGRNFIITLKCDI